uniref:RxLR effector candidate protein n=1 Tax=Peronospora matthiolae TaxID=2874970 RepID=A0AAV1TRI2_9STRA
MRVYTLDSVTIAAIMACVNTSTVMSTAVANSPLASPDTAHDPVHAARVLRSTRLADDEQRSGAGPMPVILSVEDSAPQLSKQLISTISSHLIRDGPKHQWGEMPVSHAVRSKSAMRISPGVALEKSTVQDLIHPNQVLEVADSAGKLVRFGKKTRDIKMGKKGLRYLSEHWATKQLSVNDVVADLKLTNAELNFNRIKALEDFVEYIFGVEKRDTELVQALKATYGESQLSFLLTRSLVRKRNEDYALKLLAGVMTTWMNRGFTVEKVAGMLHDTKEIHFSLVAQKLATHPILASTEQDTDLQTLKLYNGVCSHLRPRLAIKEII